MQQLASLQHRVHFHHERRQRREAAAEADRKQQTVLIRDDPGLIKPGRRRDELRDNAPSGLTQRVRHAYLRSVIRGSQTFVGMLLGTMSHDAAHGFLRVGRILERGDMTTRIIDVRSASAGCSASSHS